MNNLRNKKKIITVCFFSAFLMAACWVNAVKNDFFSLNQAVEMSWNYLEIQLQRSMAFSNELLLSLDNPLTLNASHQLDRLKQSLSQTQTLHDKLPIYEEIQEQIMEILGRVEKEQVGLKSEKRISLQLRYRDIERRIEEEAILFNKNTLYYNKNIRLFPKHWVAKLFGFQQRHEFHLSKQS